MRHTDHVAPSIRKKLAITSPTSGGRSVGMVRSRTQTMEFSFVYPLSWFLNDLSETGLSPSSVKCLFDRVRSTALTFSSDTTLQVFYPKMETVPSLKWKYKLRGWIIWKLYWYFVTNFQISVNISLRALLHGVDSWGYWQSDNWLMIGSNGELWY
jgi:hypothetical protein